MVPAVVERRGPFTLSRAEVRDLDLGATDADLDRGATDADLDRGATDADLDRDAADADLDRGAADADLDALDAAAHQIARGENVAVLDGWDAAGIVGMTEHGRCPLLEHLKKIVEDPIVWAPGVQGAVPLPA
jgi:uncharacterized linocin/CFP29 family protein